MPNPVNSHAATASGACLRADDRLAVLRLPVSVGRLRAEKTVLLLLCSVAVSCVSAKPDWVAHYGASSEYATNEYVTGYGLGSGKDGVAQAKQQAAADLARKISVRIES